MTHQHPFNITCHIILDSKKTLKCFISFNDIHFKLYFYCCVLGNEMSKTRSHLHIFSKKLNQLNFLYK
jgi:hypothetical protein